MSFYGDLRFFLVLAAALVPAAVLGLRERSLKGYSFALSLLFIWLVYGGQPAQLLWLAGFYLLELHAVKGYLLLRRKFGRNSVIYGHFVALALAPASALQVLRSLWQERVRLSGHQLLEL